MFFRIPQIFPKNKKKLACQKLLTCTFGAILAQCQRPLIDKKDVEWGFSYFLPELKKTGCKFWGFILPKVSDIEGEIDLWTQEVEKNFTVIRGEYYTDLDIRFSSGDRAQSIVIAYELKQVGGELFCDQVETKELKYFSKNDKPEMFTKSHEDLWKDVFGI